MTILPGTTVGGATVVSNDQYRVTLSCECKRSQVTISINYFRRAERNGTKIRCTVCKEKARPKRPRRRVERYLSKRNGEARPGN